MQSIYSIQNSVNGKRYIGSTNNSEVRFKAHLCKLRTGKHHSPLLQRSFEKHGEQAFVFEIIEAVEDASILYEREQWWMDKYQSYQPEHGYNIMKEAKPCLHNIGNQYNVGRKHSDETKAIISKMHKGRTHSDQSKANMSKAHMGHKSSEQTIRKFRASIQQVWDKKHEAEKGNAAEAIALYLNDATLTTQDIANRFGRSTSWLYSVLKRQGIEKERPFRAGNPWNKGKPMPPEAIEKMRQAGLGKKRPKPEGWTMSEESRQQTREKVKALWQDPEYVKMQMEARARAKEARAKNAPEVL